jgi:hypothetical protein
MRIFDILKSQLSSDKLKKEEELERILNDKSLETNKKVETVGQLLKEVVLIELSFKKLDEYMSGLNDNDNNEK